jgi:hypothetical protein
MSKQNNLISVYRAPDELSGVTIRSLLEDKGIKAVLKSSQIPWYDNIMISALGYWGEVLVRNEDKQKAENIIKDFLKAAEDKD